MDDHKETYEEEDFDECAHDNFATMHEHLMEKGFSQLEIDEMKFVPWRPNYGPNNDWVLPEGFKEYELTRGNPKIWDDLTMFVKEGTETELFIKMLHKMKRTKETDSLVWKIYNMNPKDIIIFEAFCAEYLTEPMVDESDSDSE